MDAALLDLLVHTVSVAPFTSRNPDGEASYGAPVNLAALVEYRTEAVRYARLSDPIGKTIISHAVVYLDGHPTITLEDKLTLPDGATPQILEVKKFSDPGGAYYTEVWL